MKNRIAQLAVLLAITAIRPSLADIAVKWQSDVGAYSHGGNWAAGPFPSSMGLRQLIWSPTNPASSGAKPILGRTNYLYPGEYLLATYSAGTNDYCQWLAGSAGLLIRDNSSVGGLNIHNGWIYSRMFNSTNPVIDSLSVDGWYHQGEAFRSTNVYSPLNPDGGSIFVYATPTTGTAVELNQQIITGSQAIIFPQIPDQFVSNRIGLAATATSGLTVDYAVQSGPATISSLTNVVFTGTGSVSIAAAQAGNEFWDPATTVTNTFNVSKQAATLTLGSLSQTYNGSAHAVSYTTVPTNLTVHITYDGVDWPPTNAGSYSVTGIVDDAYFIGTATGILTVARATPAIYLSNLQQVFDSTARYVSVTTAPPGLAYALTYDGDSNAPIDAGIYPLQCIVDMSNWYGLTNGTLLVNKAGSSVLLGGLIQDYDGTAKSVTATTDPDGLSLLITYNGQSSTPVMPGAYSVTARVDSVNYTGVSTGTLIIRTCSAVTTLQATAVSNTAATLNATVTPNGESTAVWFEWGESPFASGTLTTPIGVGADFLAVSVTSRLSNITPGLIYYGRIVASNALGVVNGRYLPFGSPSVVLSGPAAFSNYVGRSYSEAGANAGTESPYAISAGEFHSLALRADGRIVCWGLNDYGQTNVPAIVTNIVGLAGGGKHSLALRSNGRVVAWGWNIFGQTNVPATATGIVKVAGGQYHTIALQASGRVIGWGYNGDNQTSIPASATNIQAIAAGLSHSLAVRTDGTLIGWGANDSGQMNFPALATNITDVSSGYAHVLALRNDGSVVGWGLNDYGQATVPGGVSNIVAIAAGGYHSLALRADGTVLAWGDSRYGQTTVPLGATNILAIAAGESHSMALRLDGTIIAWGQNTNGQANIPNNLTTPIAVAIVGSVDTATPGTYVLTYIATNRFGGVGTASRTAVVLPPFAPVVNTLPAEGVSNTAAGLSATVNPGGATTRSWFEYGYSALTLTQKTPSVLVGSNDVANSVVYNMTNLTPSVTYYYRVVASNIVGKVYGLPVKYGSPNIVLNGLARQTNFINSSYGELGVNVVEGPVSVMAGGFHSLGLRNDGIVVSWGKNNYGQTNVPSNLGKASMIAAGYEHSLALQTNGTVIAWGNNTYGQTNVPINASNVIGIAAGKYHSMALRADGTLVTWGLNSDGQTDIPVTATNIFGIAAGGVHNLGLNASGRVLAWGGNNFGQTNVPASATGLVSVSASYGHSLAMRQDGRVLAWGWNAYGQTNVPANATNVVGISAGYAHSLALRQDCSVLAWGDSFQTNLPSSATNIVEVSAGDAHSLALRADGLVIGWGDNSFGQISIPDEVNQTISYSIIGSVNTACTGIYTLVYIATNSMGGVGTVTRMVEVSAISPTVFTLAATEISGTTAMIAGTVNPGGAVTAARFEWGATTNFGNLTAVTNIPATNVPQNVSAMITGLSPGSEYYFRVIASNGTGIAVAGFTLSLSTPVVAPSAESLAATSISSTSVTLNGIVNPGGAITAAYFEYGVSTNYGSISTTNMIAASNNDQPVNIPIVGLQPDAIYHFRLMATNNAGINTGADLAFTTAPFLLNLQPTYTNGNFQFGFTYQSGKVFDVIMTTNLAIPLSEWIGIGQSVEAPPGYYLIVDPTGSNSVHRFYRVTSP